jgi:hypothetical protein
MQLRLSLGAALAGLLVAGCGGGAVGDGGGASTGPLRGSLVDAPVTVATLTEMQINNATVRTGLLALTGAAQCDVRIVALNYHTVGARGEQTNASAALLVPTGPVGCTAPAPLVAYAKATDVQQARTLASATDDETLTLIAMFASHGYAVVATDYLGYAKSAYAFHPYLHADSEATSLIDAIRAARNGAGSVGLALSGRVMLTGYSQGGHASAATQRAIERDHATEINVVAGAHLAGPYNLSGALRSPIVPAGYEFFAPFVVTSYQKVYGDVYGDVDTVFRMPYAGWIETLLPNATLDDNSLLATGKLPGAHGESPAQMRDLLFQAAFVADVQTDDGSALYLDARKNDLLGWSPKARTMLCGGAGDPTVPPALHRDVLYGDMIARRVTTVSTVDVDAQIRQAYAPGGVPTDPSSFAYLQYYGNYHAGYEPPFCERAARDLFDTVR